MSDMADAIDRRRWRDSSRSVGEIDSVARHRGRDMRKCDKRQAAKTIIATGSRGHRPRISSGQRGTCEECIGANVFIEYILYVVMPDNRNIRKATETSW